MPRGDTFLNGRQQNRNVKVNKIYSMTFFHTNSFGTPVLVVDPKILKSGGRLVLTKFGLNSIHGMYTSISVKVLPCK